MFKSFLSCLSVAALAAGLVAPAHAKAKKPKARLVQIVYPVADLVVPVDMKGEGKPLKTVESILVEVIRRGIAPESWEEKGGKGTIDYFPLGMALTIRQTQAVQEQIQDMLAALRKLQDIEVAAELRILRVSEATLERLGADSNSEAACLFEQQEEVVLDDAQCRRLLEAAQGDRRSNIMQAPRVTVFNGQRATLRVGDTHACIDGLDVVEEADRIVIKAKKETVTAGLEFAIWPVVAADRRSVTMNLDVKLTELAAQHGSWTSACPDGTRIVREPSVENLPVTLVTRDKNGTQCETQLPLTVQRPALSTLKVNRTVQIPDGKTAVFRLGKRVFESRIELGPPVLRDIPYLNRLFFRNVGYGQEAQHVLVLVTSRIVVAEETESRPPALSPGTEGPIAMPATAPASK